ncbi:hypothetical protein CMI37_35265 [Candidatus Pacearchaeota archaeon]|nr:hypothetical protein [Candidatus Pacearchaeota archaeon]
MKEVEHILRILKETREAFDTGDVVRVKHLSNQTIHTAAISQDGDNVVVAVLVYALGKVLERERYREMAGWDVFYKTLIKNFDIAIKSLEKNDIEKFREAVGAIRNCLNEIDEDLGLYIQDVFRKAEINKAFKLYEHGLSSEQTAKLLGVSLWDLSTYIGQSSISEAFASETLPVQERVKIAEEIFE